jgi:hypothetical protein
MRENQIAKARIGAIQKLKGAKPLAAITPAAKIKNSFI